MKKTYYEEFIDESVQKLLHITVHNIQLAIYFGSKSKQNIYERNTFLKSIKFDLFEHVLLRCIAQKAVIYEESVYFLSETSKAKITEFIKKKQSEKFKLSMIGKAKI